MKGCKTKGIFICEWRKRKDGCPLKLLFNPKKIYFARICQLRGICSESRFTEVGIKNYNSLKIRWFHFSNANFSRLPCREQILNMSLITETTSPMKDYYDFVLLLLLFAMNQGISLRECIIFVVFLLLGVLVCQFTTLPSHSYHTPQKRNESRTNSDPLLIGLIIIFMTNWLISPQNVKLLFPTRSTPPFLSQFTLSGKWRVQWTSWPNFAAQTRPISGNFHRISFT